VIESEHSYEEKESAAVRRTIDYHQNSGIARPKFQPFRPIYSSRRAREIACQSDVKWLRCAEIKNLMPKYLQQEEQLRSKQHSGAARENESSC
jgi:hypothetical protein